MQKEKSKTVKKCNSTKKTEKKKKTIIIPSPKPKSKNLGRIATKGDWKTKEMPKSVDQFMLERKFNKKELEHLKKGHIPEAMEDKWFYYYENDKLYAHRSWTGNCIYIIEFDFKTNKHLVTVNRNKRQYGCVEIKEDLNQLNMLLNYWIKTKYDYCGEWLEETINMLNN